MFDKHLFFAMISPISEEGHINMNIKPKLHLFPKNKLYWLLNMNHMMKNCQQILNHYQNQGLKSNGMILPISLNYKQLLDKMMGGYQNLFSYEKKLFDEGFSRLDITCRDSKFDNHHRHIQ